MGVSTSPGGVDASAPAPASGDGRAHHRRDVEGLRAIAILAVVLYHAHVGFAGGGYVGVDIFLVVSGFLITGLLWRELERHGRVSFGAFYGRRARRLLPASALVVVATVVASARWLPPLRVHDIVKDAVASSLYVANFRFAFQSTNYLTSTAPPSPFQHFWSLAVEEQFYLVWPALLVGIWAMCSATGRHGKRSVTSSRARVAIALGAVCAASFALSLWLTRVDQPWAFFSLPSRAWELGAGGLLALTTPWLRRLPQAVCVGLGWTGMALLVWSITRLSDSTAFPGTAALAPVLATAAVIAAGTAGGLFGPVALLGMRVFQVIGKVSYSWYLWHWPVLIIAAGMASRPLGVWDNVGLVALSGVLAAATVVLVEAPVRYSVRLSARPLATASLAGSLTAMAALACGLVAVTLPPLQGQGPAALTGRSATPAIAPLTSGAGLARPASGPATTVDPAAAAYAAAEAPVVAAVAASVTAVGVPSNLEPSLGRAHADKARPFVDGCLDGFTETGVGTCAYGVTSSSTTVVLFGDSHAAQWFPAVDDLANSRGWRLVVMTKSTCPPVDIGVFSPVLGRTYRECDEWKANVLARIRAEHPALVVLGVARHYTSIYHLTVYSQAWTQGLASMVTTISQSGAKVAVMGAIPKPEVDIPDCLSAHLAASSACGQPFPAVYESQGVNAERAAVTAAGGLYVDTHSWFCTASICPVVVGNLMVYRDDNHLTTAYTSWLAPVVGAALGEAPVPTPPPSGTVPSPSGANPQSAFGRVP